MTTPRLYRQVLLTAAGPLLLILLWEAVARFGAFERSLLPSPGAVAAALGELWADGSLLTSIAVSLLRFAAGYLSAAGAGIGLGLVLGRLPVAWGLVNPVAQLLRPVSPIAWFPLIVLFFGIGNLPAVVIIFIASFFPVLLSTVAAVRATDPLLLKVARNFGIRQPRLTSAVIFPAAFPAIAVSLHIALGSAWVFLVAGEMVGAQSGLGFLIIDGRNNLRTDVVLAGIAVIGVLGLLLDRLITVFERWVGRRWGDHATGGGAHD
ncbi:MAG: ABC transporter permease [Lentisphaerae bacterium]|nr:ABC transporter permease [Lentisphaerota bacterium]